MKSKTLTDKAMSIVNDYLHFRVGTAINSVPYYNNKINRARIALRVHSGKGSPKEIFDEIQAIAVKNRISMPDLTSDSLKQLLVENDIGIDCSGLAYHILNTESVERYKKNLYRGLTFIKCKGFVDKIRCALRPVQNTDVATLDHDLNSRRVGVGDAEPGDFITFIGTTADNRPQRDHIILIHEVLYEDSVPKKIRYTHSIAYPEDGVYGTGVRQDSIEIRDPSLPITDAIWNEQKLFERSKKSKVEIRRLKWF